MKFVYGSCSTVPERTATLPVRPREDALMVRQRAAMPADLKRIEADQARLIEERPQLQDKLEEAHAEADHCQS